MTRSGKACLRVSLAALLLISLGGCAAFRVFESPVEVREMKPGEYISLKRGDILTTGTPGTATRETVSVAGLDAGVCARLDRPAPDCRMALQDAAGISDERRLSALAELWTQQALSSNPVDGSADARLQAWLEAGRYAYAYLFFTRRSPRDRAFEDRQTQVRDYYNLAVQEVARTLFTYRRQQATGTPAMQDTILAGWTIHTDVSAIRISRDQALPNELVPASSLAFRGLRSQYRRDGFGAELVASMGAARVGDRSAQPPIWSEMPYPTITALLRFEGRSLDDILTSRKVTLAVYDPYEHDTALLRGQNVPLAGDFTAGYGLWLARSGFTTQSLRVLLGREQGVDRPHLYMMQPYDPDRRILVMIHGLASSPEAWVNVANEIIGDETLRQHFQVWQLYYPTNMPIALNHYDIRRAISLALVHFDPSATQPASHGMVLIGHSMGGVIARLLVSSSGDHLLERTLAGVDLSRERRRRLDRYLAPVLNFEPLPSVERVIFIATPHRGTVVAGERLGRWLAGMIRLPLTVLQTFADVIQEPQGETRSGSAPLQFPNSIDNLREDDPFIRAAADLGISPKVHYHSIIARTSADGDLADTDDGLVPYRSAHLPGAVSEKIIQSGHSVQETAASIIELRRILHEDLKDRADQIRAQARD